MRSALRFTPVGLTVCRSPTCRSGQYRHTAACLVSYPFNVRGGAKNAGATIREIRNGRTSDGRRRLLSMKDLFEEKGLSGDGQRSKPPGLFSRDGVIKLVGVASVAYIGKQFFNGGR